jgi:predicted outer membrane protein
MNWITSYRRHLVKRLISIVALVLVGTAVALAATIRTTTARPAAHPPTKASLMDAYVEAAKYWQNRPVSAPSAPSVKPPTTASLMPAYVEAAKYWQSRKPAR